MAAAMEANVIGQIVGQVAGNLERARELVDESVEDSLSLKLPYRATAKPSGKSMGRFSTKAPLEWTQPVDHEHLYDDVDQIMHAPANLAHGSRRRHDFHNHQLGRGAVVAANVALFVAIFFLTPHF